MHHQLGTAGTAPTRPIGQAKQEEKPTNSHQKPPALPQSSSKDQNANNQNATDQTPKKRFMEEINKAIHKPNTVIKLDAAKLLFMTGWKVALKYIKETTKAYLTEFWGD